MYTPIYICTYVYTNIYMYAKPIAKHLINLANKTFNCIFTLPLTKSQKCKQEAITSHSNNSLHTATHTDT